jgi:hypothetical protein
VSPTLGRSPRTAVPCPLRRGCGSPCADCTSRTRLS